MYFCKMKNIIRYLIQELQPLRKHGEKDFKVIKSTESDFCLAFKDAIIKSYFKFDESGTLMIFNGKCYEFLSDEDFRNIILRVMENIEAGKVYIVNSLRVICNFCIVAIRNFKFIPDRNYISFNNLVLNTETYETFSHSPEIMTRRLIPYDYNPKAKCEQFLDFISYVLPNTDVLEVLQMFTGCFLLDRRKLKIENMCFLIGTGLNGKGVFMNTILNTLGGSDNCTNFSLSELIMGNTALYNRAKMNGKLANICLDSSKTDFSGGDFKALTSGEPIHVREIFKTPYMATDMPFMMTAVNEAPITSDHSKGYLRRLLWIPFTKTIPESKVDKGLEARLAEEKSGIFNWMLEGKRKIEKANGVFPEVKEIMDITQKLKVEGNNILLFLLENSWVANSEAGFERVFLTDLYGKYTQFCKDNGHNSFSRIKFGNMLRQEKFKEGRTSKGVYFKMYKVELKEVFDEEEIEEFDGLPF